MGKAIEALAISKGHSIGPIINHATYKADELKGADVAIEFSQPDAAVSNILKCFEARIPVVVGTTGWNQDYDRIVDRAIDEKQALFTASNFSIGVNIVFHLNRQLARIMNQFPDYEVQMLETHHIHKKDHPSGTAVSIAQDIIAALDRKKGYVGQLEGQELKGDAFDLQIISKRENEVPGFHQINYKNSIDQISLSHNALNRSGFAQGALMAAEWLVGKTGVFGMNDLLKFDQ